MPPPSGRLPAGLLIGRILAPAGMICAPAGLYLISIATEAVGIVLGVVGYFLGARGLGALAVVLGAAAMIYGLLTRGYPTGPGSRTWRRVGPPSSYRLQRRRMPEPDERAPRRVRSRPGVGPCLCLTGRPEDCPVRVQAKVPALTVGAR